MTVGIIRVPRESIGISDVEVGDEPSLQSHRRRGLSIVLLVPPLLYVGFKTFGEALRMNQPWTAFVGVEGK